MSDLDSNNQQQGSREAAMVVIQRDGEGKPTVWCDPEIVDLVTALNAGGIPTVASCSGHGARNGIISLRDGRELIVAGDYGTARRYERAIAAQPAAAQEFVCTGDELRCHDGHGCECAMRGLKPAAAQEAVATVESFTNGSYHRNYKLRWHKNVDAGTQLFAAPVTAAPAEMSPEFTDTARAAIAWVLWHHQGGSSPVGQPLRFALGMGAHEPLPDWRIAEAKRYAEWAGATTAEFHNARPVTAAPDDASALIHDLRAAVSIGRPLQHSDVDEIERVLGTPAAPVDTWFADQLTAMGEVIPLASTPAAPGIDPTDPWRGLYDQTRMPKLDGVSDYVAAHPDLPEWPEDEERSIALLIRAQGFEWDAVSGDYGTDYMSVDEFDTCAWLAAWKPEPPAGEGWRLVLVHYTEDGPVAVFVRPLALIDASSKGGSGPLRPALVDAAALRRALAEYPGRNTHQLQARKVCAGVLALAESYGAEARNSPKDGSDTARLDSGMIRLSHRDEFGEDGYILHTGVNLRAAIDAAMKAQAGDAEVQP